MELMTFFVIGRVIKLGDKYEMRTLFLEFVLGKVSFVLSGLSF